MLRPWPCAFAPVALSILAVATGPPEIISRHEPHKLQQGPALLAENAKEWPTRGFVGAPASKGGVVAAPLLRAEDIAPSTRKDLRSGSGDQLDKSSEEQMSAVVSSKGIRYISPHRADQRKHHSALMETVRKGQSHGHAKASVPDVSQIAGKNATAPASIKSKGAQDFNAVYFGVGVGVFLLGQILIHVSLLKLNYTQEHQGMLQEGNPQGEDEPARDEAREASLNPVHPGELIQHRMQQVLVSWVFIAASIAYYLDFLSLHAGFGDGRHWFSVMAYLLWFLGFVIQAHWQFSVGTTRIQLAGTLLKALACLIGQVHPLEMIMRLSEDEEGVWWPAVFTNGLWHVGNIVSCADFWFVPPPGASLSAGPFAHVNLPVTEMWIDQYATWLLFIASACLTQWLGRPENQLLAVKNLPIVCCQYGGATLFLIASCIKTEWCNGFRNCRHRPE